MTDIETLQGMHVLPLWQPYASLMFSDAKRHETRSFCPPSAIQGQRVAIHATLKAGEKGHLLDIIAREHSLGRLPHRDVRGAIIGTLVIKEWRRVVMPPELMTTEDDIRCGDWSMGRWVWLKDAPIIFDKPVAYSGEQGIKRFNPERLR